MAAAPATSFDQWESNRDGKTIEGPFVVTALWGHWRLKNTGDPHDAGTLINDGGKFPFLPGMQFFVPAKWVLEVPRPSGPVHMWSGFRPKNA